MPSLSGLEGLRTLIVGSTAGMGYETAGLFLRSGAHVAINGRSADRAHGALAALGAEGDKCVIVVGDVGTAEGAGDVITEAVLRLGGLDALVVSGASTSSPPPDFFENSDPSSFADWARVHWLSKMYCTHHALPHLRQSNDASIVYLSTDGGRFPTVGESFACGAAAALHMMTRTLALEFKRHKVRVNTVATTAMLGTPGLDVDLGGAKKVFEKALRRQALPLEPIDVAEAVAYLSSRAARSITGQILSVNGGTSTGL